MDLKEEWEKSEDGLKEQEMKIRLREEKKAKKDFSTVIKITAAVIALAFAAYAIVCIVVFALI